MKRFGWAFGLFVVHLAISFGAWSLAERGLAFDIAWRVLSLPLLSFMRIEPDDHLELLLVVNSVLATLLLSAVVRLISRRTKT